MKRIISVLLSITLILSLCIISASAGDMIINLSDEDAEAKITENANPDTTVNVMVFPDYPGPDFTENNAAMFEKISAVIPSAKLAPKYRTDRSSFVITMPAGEFTKLKDIDGIYDAEMFLPAAIPTNDDGTVNILITYGYTMTAIQQKQYDDGDWDGKTAILKERYAASKADLLEYIDSVCEYDVLRDTSINRIYLRVPASAVDVIKQAELVKSIRYLTPSESKLNGEAQKLIAEADPGKIVTVYVTTDRGDVAAMRNYFNVTKQEMNAYFAIEDENGVNEWLRASKAFYADYHQKLLSEITEKTDAVYMPHTSLEHGDEVFRDLDTSCWTRFYVPVGQLQTLAQIEGIAAIAYEPPKEADPYQDWYWLGGDLDLARKICGEPNESGMFYVPAGVSFPTDEEEYARFKEIDYVKGVKYCRPAPTDGWWKLEGDEALLKATYGEPNADGRYYVPKKDAVKGDVDYDYDLTILDATGIQRELAELAAKHFNKTCADYDEDGDVTILDATAIQRTLVDL